MVTIITRLVETIQPIISAELAKLKNNVVNSLSTPKEDKYSGTLQDSSSSTYSNEIIKRPNESLGTNVLVKFPKISGSTIGEIEKNINFRKSTVEPLKKLKSLCTDEEYQLFLGFIKEISNELNNRTIISTRGKEDPMPDLLQELISYKDSFTYKKGSLRDNLEKYKISLRAQKEIGVLFTFKNYDVMLQNPKGVQTIKNMVRSLANAGVELRNEYFDLLSNYHLYLRTYLENRKVNPIKSSTESSEYALDHLNRFLEGDLTKAIIRLEKLQPGAGRYLKGWLLPQSPYKKEANPLYIEYPIDLLHDYTERLALQGETEIADAIQSFEKCNGAIIPTGNIVNKALKLHQYAGIVRLSRFLDQKPDKQKNLEARLNHFVSAFEDPNFKKNNNIALVFLPGVIEDDEKDVFSGAEGNRIQALIDNDYKVFPFEGDTDEQILEAINRVYKLTGRTPDVYMFSGHGSTDSNGRVNGKSINIGETRREIAFRSIAPEVLTEIRKRYSMPVSTEIVLPQWGVKNVSKGITYNNAAFDVGDVDLMKKIRRINTSSKPIAIFDSCGSGNEDDGKPCLARVFAENTGIKTYAAKYSINGLYGTQLKFKNGEIIGVSYVNFGEGEVKTMEFLPSK